MYLSEVGRATVQPRVSSERVPSTGERSSGRTRATTVDATGTGGTRRGTGYTGEPEGHGAGFLLAEPEHLIKNIEDPGTQVQSLLFRHTASLEILFAKFASSKHAGSGGAMLSDASMRRLSREVKLCPALMAATAMRKYFAVACQRGTSAKRRAQGGLTSNPSSKVSRHLTLEFFTHVHLCAAPISSDT